MVSLMFDVKFVKGMSQFLRRWCDLVSDPVSDKVSKSATACGIKVVKRMKW